MKKGFGETGHFKKNGIRGTEKEGLAEPGSGHCNYLLG